MNTANSVNMRGVGASWYAAPASYSLGVRNLVTVSEAARLLGMSETSVRRLCNQGHLRSERASGVRVIQREDVERLIADRASRGARR